MPVVARRIRPAVLSWGKAGMAAVVSESEWLVECCMCLIGVRRRLLLSLG